MANKSKKIMAEISAGELLDKLTILEIKLYKIENLEKKKVIKEEIKALKEVIDKFLDWNKNKDVTILFGKLRQTNEKLWVIEDKIRIHEKEKNFNKEFIELARSVYINNDERFKIKSKINMLLDSNIQEVKEYADY
tara:strand:- start:243 stop:650 length:408 start_codon:yes stop_codon:yes gene_type:complete